MRNGDAQSSGPHHVYHWDFTDFAYIFGFLDKLALDDLRASNKRMAPYWRGKPVEGGLPSELFLRASGDRYDARGKLADVFCAGTPITVSAKARSILAAHDLGGSVWQDVTLFRPDYETPYDGEYSVLQVVPMKETVIPELSKSFRPMSVSDTPFIGYVASDANPDDTAVLPSSLEGPDIWRDPGMQTEVFVSDRLAKALRRGRLRIPKLVRCQAIVMN